MQEAFKYIQKQDIFRIEPCPLSFLAPDYCCPAWSKTDPYWQCRVITVVYLGKEIGGDRVHAILQLMVQHGSLCVTCRGHEVSLTTQCTVHAVGTV